MSALFHLVDDAFCILRNKGVYKQAKLYQRRGRLYAGWGTGFIALLRSGNTSHPDAKWDDIQGAAVQDSSELYLSLRVGRVA